MGKGLILSILCITILSQVQCKSDYLIINKELNKIGSSSDYGNTLVSTIQLKLATGGKVNEVINILKELLASFRAASDRDGLDFSKRSNQFRNDIEKLENNIQTLTSQISAAGKRIEFLENDISLLESTSSSVSGQLKQLEEQQTIFQETREKEELAASQRIKDYRRILTALDTIVEKLGQAAGSSATGKKALFMQIIEDTNDQLGSDNPIAVFIQNTLKMKNPQIKTVLTKIKQIQASVQALLQEEESHESTSASTHTTLQTQLDAIRSGLLNQGDSGAASLKSKQTELILLEKSKKSMQQDTSTTKQILSTLKQQKDTYALAYNSRKTQRAKQFQAIREAYELLLRSRKSVAAASNE